MSILAPASKAGVLRPRLSIKDTEFLLRILMGSNIQIREAKQAVETLEKIKFLHNSLMEKTIEVKTK